MPLFLAAAPFSVSSPPRFSYIYSYRLAPVAPTRHVFMPTRVYWNPETLDMMAFGDGMLRGTVTVQGVPSSQRVMAMDKRRATFINGAQSDPITGAFTIYPLVGKRPYLVIGTDAKTRFNAVVADGVIPVPWEEETP